MAKSDSTNPLVSVIILNYNGKRNLGQLFFDCLNSALKTDYPAFEILFVDNASTDGSVASVQKQFGENKNLRIIINKQNLGYPAGNNVGIRQAKGEYIALLNSDTIVDPLWLRELVIAIQPPEIGAAQSKLLLHDNPALMDCAGGFIDQYAYHHYEVGYKENANRYNNVYEIFYAKGASIIIKRSALKIAGLFEPGMFLFFDETDLCWRIRLSGYRIIFVPTSIVLHASGKSASKLQDQKRLYYSTRNRLFSVITNYNAKNMLNTLMVSLIWEMRNIVKFVATRKPHLVVAVVTALLWNLDNFDYVWRRRRQVQKFVRKVSDETIQKAMLKPFPPFPLSLIYSRAHYSSSEV